jgi:hypothetical protein
MLTPVTDRLIIPPVVARRAALTGLVCGVCGLSIEQGEDLPGDQRGVTWKGNPSASPSEAVVMHRWCRTLRRREPNADARHSQDWYRQQFIYKRKFPESVYNEVKADTRSRTKAKRANQGIGISSQEMFSVAAIGVRDNWTCQLCFGQVEPNPAAVDTQYLRASIDHRDEGGPHTLNNVQLTHECCNNFRDHARQVAYPHTPTVEQYRAVHQSFAGGLVSKPGKVFRAVLSQNF